MAYLRRELIVIFELTKPNNHKKYQGSSPYQLSE